MIKINLIPAEYLEKVNRRMMIAKIVMVAGTLILIVAGVSLYQYGRSKKTDMLLAEKERQFTKLQNDVEKVKAIEAQISEVKKYLNAIDRISKNKFTYPYLMQDIIEDLPKSMWFNSVRTSAARDKTDISAGVKSHSACDLAYWIDFLEKDERFSGLEIGPISISEEKGANTLSTTIKFTYAR